MERLPPKKFKLAGKVWTIQYDDRLDDDGELGNCVGYNCKIAYGIDATKNHQQFRDTILHECMHAICYETGLAFELKEDDIKVDEEMIVRRMSTFTLALFRDNAKLAAFLLGV